MFKSYGNLRLINSIPNTILFFSLEAAIPFQSTTCRFWQWADEAIPVFQDIAMQIAALQDDSRGVAAFRPVA